MTKTKIEWTDETWNPVTGCTKVSPGCAHCYAEKMAHRLKAMGQDRYRNGFDLTLQEDVVDRPLGWKTPRRVFVNSMSDLFHQDVPVDFIAQVFATMYECQWHTFQVLTKRPERMADIVDTDIFRRRVGMHAWDARNMRTGQPPTILTAGEVIDDVQTLWPLPNVWLGTSVENQKYADERIPHLLRAEAAVRFLSCEPLLGPLDLDLPRCESHDREFADGAYCSECGADGYSSEMSYGHWLDCEPGQGIDWVIVGGESGKGARRMQPDWPSSIQQQCLHAGVAFFFKQWGAIGADGVRRDKKKNGRKLHGRTYDEYPETTGQPSDVLG